MVSENYACAYKEVIVEEVATNNVAMIEYKESIFKKFINKIKQIFKIS